MTNDHNLAFISNSSKAKQLRHGEPLSVSESPFTQYNPVITSLFSKSVSQTTKKEKKSKTEKPRTFPICPRKHPDNHEST